MVPHIFLSVRTDGDLADAAVEGSRRDIVAAAAGLTVYNTTRHLSGMSRLASKQVYSEAEPLIFLFFWFSTSDH